MENIRDILARFGVTEAAGDIERAVLDNYRTKAETDEKAAKIKELAEHNAGLEAELTKLKDLDTSNAAEVEAMRARMAELEADAEERAKAKKAQEARTAFDEAFDKELNGRKFANDLMAETVREKSYAMANANPNMSMGDVLKQVTGDANGVWLNPQTDPHKMPAGDGAATGSPMPITSLEQVKGMSADEINKNWDSISKLLAANK